MMHHLLVNERHKKAGVQKGSMETITGIEGKKNVWIIFVLVAVIVFFANLGLRYMFEREVDVFYSILVTMLIMLAYFLLTLFLNIRKAS